MTYRRAALTASSAHRDKSPSTWAEVHRLLAPHVRRLGNAVFRQSLAGHTTVAAFDALSHADQPVTGTLVVQSSASDHHLVSRVEVNLYADAEGGTRDSPRAFNQEEVANATRDLLRWMSEDPDRGSPSIRVTLGALLARVTAPSSERVAQRFQRQSDARQHLKQAGKLLTTRVEMVEVTYSDGGVITAQDVARMIEPHVGEVFRLTFGKSKTGLPNSVAWEAVDADGDLVWGALVLHAAISDSQVVSWAEIEIDKPIGPSARKKSASVRDTQLETIARMGRDLIRKLHTKARVATPELLGALVAIVDEAEAEAPTRSVERVAERFLRSGCSR